jgi:hypothetical protein
VQRGPHPLGDAGRRLQVGQASAEFRGEEPPELLVLGEERAVRVGGREGDRVRLPLVDFYAEVRSSRFGEELVHVSGLW